jgi:hypothetical protein
MMQKKNNAKGKDAMICHASFRCVCPATPWLRACIFSMVCGTVAGAAFAQGYGGRGGEMADASSFAKAAEDWILGFGGG